MMANGNHNAKIQEEKKHQAVKEQKAKCIPCNGTGITPTGDFCATCGGTGKVTLTIYHK
jgi:RecJ-like exonuclease